MEQRTKMIQQRSSSSNTNINNKGIRRILVTKGLHTKYVLKNNKQRKKGFDGSISGSGSSNDGNDDGSGNKPLFQQQQQQQQQQQLQQQRRSKL